VFPVAINQTCRCQIIFKTFNSKTLCNLSRKASEPLINSTYSFFLAIFTICAMHEIMRYRLFTFLYMYPRCWFACIGCLLSRICILDVGLHMGRIALLSPAVIAWLLSR
jgi:hypothetical protein